MFQQELLLCGGDTAKIPELKKLTLYEFYKVLDLKYKKPTTNGSTGNRKVNS